MIRVTNGFVYDFDLVPDLFTHIIQVYFTDTDCPQTSETTLKDMGKYTPSIQEKLWYNNNNKQSTTQLHVYCIRGVRISLYPA